MFTSSSPGESRKWLAEIDVQLTDSSVPPTPPTRTTKMHLRQATAALLSSSLLNLPSTNSSEASTILYNDGGIHEVAMSNKYTNVNVDLGTNLTLSSFTSLSPPPCNTACNSSDARATIEVTGGSYLKFDGMVVIISGSNYTTPGGTAVHISEGSYGEFGMGLVVGGKAADEGGVSGVGVEVSGVGSTVTIDGTTLMSHMGGEGTPVQPGNALVVSDGATVTIQSGDIQYGVVISGGSSLSAYGGYFREPIQVIGLESFIRFYGCFQTNQEGDSTIVSGVFSNEEGASTIDVLTSNGGMIELEEVGICETPSPPTKAPTNVPPVAEVTAKPTSKSPSNSAFGVGSVYLGWIVSYALYSSV